MIAQLVCNDCHSETSLFGFVVREDLKYTSMAHLLETEIKTAADFDSWLDRKKRDGSAVYLDDGTLIIDGEKILDEWQRWEEGDCVCPECGSKNCYWF